MQNQKSDDDEALYLKLNPDLANINMDLRKHYLVCGQNEKRKYRHLDLAEITDSPLRIFWRFKRLFLPQRLPRLRTSVIAA